MHTQLTVYLLGRFATKLKKSIVNVGIHPSSCFPMYQCANPSCYQVLDIIQNDGDNDISRYIVITMNPGRYKLLPNSSTTYIGSWPPYPPTVTCSDSYTLSPRLFGHTLSRVDISGTTPVNIPNHGNNLVCLSEKRGKSFRFIEYN